MSAVIELKIDRLSLDKEQLACISELEGALGCVDYTDVPAIIKVLWYHEGEYEYTPFHWLCELEDGQVAHIEASCDACTGWEICGDVRIFRYASYEHVFSPVGIPTQDTDGIKLREPMSHACYSELFDEQVEEVCEEKKNVHEEYDDTPANPWSSKNYD